MAITTYIAGTITTPAGDPAPHVTVNLTGDATQTTVTDADGHYRFDGLAPGYYTITPSQAETAFDPPVIDTTIYAA